MTVTQIYELMNTVTGEVLGDSVIVQEDLSNVVDLGNSFINANSLDNFVRSLNDHVGRMIFTDRVYKGRVPSLLLDGWEYGGILEKISPELFDATENESWDLTDGENYNPNIFTKPKISVKCWNKRVTFEIPVSITEMQVKSAFTSATQLNAFISMIYTAVENSMTLKLDSLIMRTINNFIGETVYSDYGVALATPVTDTETALTSGIKAVNLLYLYNTDVNKGTAITAEESLTNPEFIRFATLTLTNYIDRMKDFSVLFNIGGKERFTPEDKMHIVMLSEFKNSANVYLQSDTFNEQYTALPEAEIVTKWQGTGTDFKFENTSAINIITSGGTTIDISGVLCVIFDRGAMGVTNMNPRVTTQYNAKAEFWNEWHKVDAGYFNDTNENGVVFFVA